MYHDNIVMHDHNAIEIFDGSFIVCLKWNDFPKKIIQIWNPKVNNVQYCHKYLPMTECFMDNLLDVSLTWYYV